MTLVLDHADPAPGAASSDPMHAAGRGTLSIGLVNNMPDGALRATERQFVHLLRAAAGATPVRFHRYHLPSIARGPEAAAYLAAQSRDAAALGRVRLDALVVTGCEPKAATLTDEPYWADFVRLVGWVRDSGTPSYWSCLAAHAAVLALDGIERHRLPAKRCGLLTCEARTSHPLLDGVATRLAMPHSRWNDLDADELEANRYTVLTGSAEAGANLFVRDGLRSALFGQGHPEYEPDSLAREYRRDVARFLRHESDRYPGLPTGYFDAATQAALAAFESLARADRGALRLGDLPRALAPQTGGSATWQAAVVPVFRNWLAAADAGSAVMGGHPRSREDRKPRA